ncbi:MAG TPA: SDR family NAD(P)-dependent oxidoreductase [Hypericibacter adhaerens]|uniref:Short-chain dehydrogenase/reductase n=1 Tax=Hypericibacter adhaerens TaxID=2602016 RepID=A0A5J6MUR0_9PROT|nr:SDR family NAD(P)-dependent oxidoreductase [Hypericibacter adhaerens]QEX20914.1 short-chain dehydrogenase/reductase [Hypericibacter adhaerens]HWA42662.1 SDR family NAD(P)-dependent oxidoreductase [Hypericibacter adhaerens]
MTAKIILVAGAARGLGRMTAQALAQSGHTVYASMGGAGGCSAAQAKQVQAYARDHGVDLRAIELDPGSDASVGRAVGTILNLHGRIDILVHSAGPMAYGPAEAFTPEQFAALYGSHVIAAQRINRAVLPPMRRCGRGLLVWISASGVAGGVPPYLAGYLAAKAGLDALAVQYAGELARWGIETSIVVPGLLFRDPGRFIQTEHPADEARAAEYEAGPYRDFARQIEEGVARRIPSDADPGKVAGAIAGIVDTPFGERPFRLHVDPGDDGGSVAFPVIDRVRSEMLRRLGFADLLNPRITGPEANGK